jgi:hypothetical protein
MSPRSRSQATTSPASGLKVQRAAVTQRPELRQEDVALRPEALRIFLCHGRHSSPRDFETLRDGVAHSRTRPSALSA